MEINTDFEQQELCANNHPLHSDCLKGWLVHSHVCPLCNEPFSAQLIEKYQGFLDQKEKEKEEEFKKLQEEETLKHVENIGNKIAFLKKIETVNTFTDQKKFDQALERLESFNHHGLDNYKGQMVAFLKGKINFLRGRFDLAISNLFKLVKEKFDYPDAFLYLGKAYQELGLEDKAKWAFERVKPKK